MRTTKKPGALFVLFLVLLMGSTLWLFQEGDSYYRYVSGTLESAASTAPLNKESVLESNKRPPEKFNTEVKYRKFFITAPGAKQVELRADFNRWGKDPIVLTPYKKGYFETSIALAGGEYKYVFAVDGEEIPDPSNQDRQTLEDGREICIKTVR